MFANGSIHVQNVEGRPYIDLIDTFQHLNNSANAIDVVNPEMAAVLFTVAQTLGELAVYHVEKDDVDNVDDIVSLWATQ